jgi:hypothetical protein
MVNSPLRMLDLYSGFGGAHRAMLRPAWSVVDLDLDPNLVPSVVADIRHLPVDPGGFDLIWASPPCTYYSRRDQVGIFPNEPEPSHELVRAAIEIIRQGQPSWFVIENVRGAQRYWGRATYHLGPYYLWTNLPYRPVVGPLDSKLHLDRGPRRQRANRRSIVPLTLSLAIADQVVDLAWYQPSWSRYDDQCLPRLHH